MSCDPGGAPSGGVFSLRLWAALFPLRDALRGRERLQRKPLLNAEQLAPSPTRRTCGVFLHDPACQGRDVADIFDAGDAAAGERLAVHDAGVELYRADGVAQPAIADRVHLRVVLDGLPGQGRVEGGFPLLEEFRRGFHRGFSKRQVAITIKSDICGSVRDGVHQRSRDYKPAKQSTKEKGMALQEVIWR